MSLISILNKKYFLKKKIEKSLAYLEKNSNQSAMSEEEIFKETSSTYQLILRTYPLSKNIPMRDLDNLIHYLDRLKSIEKRYKVKN